MQLSANASKEYVTVDQSKIQPNKDLTSNDDTMVAEIRELQ